ncbi:MAG: glycosyltransferase family 39 protein [Candidatus Roizmanbacteria bacterium]
MQITHPKSITKYGSLFGLLVIVIFAAIFRFWNLGTAPKGLLIDEASFGYIAKSLAETGKDEHGVSYPIVFEAFGDQKMPLQAYLLTPIIKVFGMNNVTVRSVSAVAGVMIVIGIYLLVSLTFTSRWGLLAAGITAVSPWSFYLSRFAWESNVALCLFIFGLYFLFRSFKYRSLSCAWLMMIMWALTWYTYIAYRPITGLLGVVFVLLAYRQKLFSIKKLLLLCVVALVLVIPLFVSSARDANTARLNQLGSQNNTGMVMRIDEKRAYCSSHASRLWCFAAWNKPILLIDTYAKRVMRTYSFDYLFAPMTGNLLFATVDNGEFVEVLAPLLYVGIAVAIYQLIRKSKNPLSLWVCVGIVVSILPAIYVGDMHRVRGSALYPFLILSMIWGAASIWSHLVNRWQKAAISALFIGFFIVQTYVYLMNWFTVHVDQYDFKFDGFVAPLMQYLGKRSEDSRVYIKPFTSDPILTYGYYNDVDPKIYQSEVVYGKREADGFRHAIQLGNIFVSELSPGAIGCENKQHRGPLLYVTNIKESPDAIYTVKSTDGVHSLAFVYDVRSFTPDATCEK